LPPSPPLAEGANGTLGHKGSAFSCRVALPSPLMGNVQEATSVSAVTVGAANDGPRTARPSRGSTLQLLGRRDGCHAAAVLVVGSETGCSTRFGHDDTTPARPLTATAAADMATSWRTGRQHRKQDREHDRRQSVNDRTGRPTPHRRARPHHRMRSGVTCPPHQASPAEAAFVQHAVSGQLTAECWSSPRQRRPVGSCMPSSGVGWQPSQFLTDRAEAERAFQLAERLGSVRDGRNAPVRWAVLLEG
jgi:hypothetical protein